jgi:hypothetical protein
MGLRSALALAAAIGTLSCAAAARAQDAPQPTPPPPAAGAAPTDAQLAEARHSFELGRQLFDSRDYAAAADEFRAAYELTHHPDLLFNVYLALERARRPEEAEPALAQYLAEGTVEPEQRALLERRLERLRARLAARSAIDAEPEDDGSMGLIREVDPAADLEPPTRRPARPDSTGQDAGIALMIGAGVLAASFAVFAILSQLEDGSLARTCGSEVGSYCTSSQTSALLAYGIAADASWIGALALGTVGIILYFAAAPSQPARARAGVAPWLAPGAGGLAAGGRF